MKRIKVLSLLVITGLLVSGCFGSEADRPECSICQEQVDQILPVADPKTAVASTQLFCCEKAHYFHAACIAGWLQTRGINTTCPLCRAQLLANPQNLPAIVQAALPDHTASEPAQQPGLADVPADQAEPIDEAAWVDEPDEGIDYDATAAAEIAYAGSASESESDSSASEAEADDAAHEQVVHAHEAELLPDDPDDLDDAS